MRTCLFAFLFLLLPAVALAAPYSSLYVFGDSLSDGGNAYLLTGGTFPPSPPYAHRFSNGPVAVEQLAAFWGIPFAPSVLGGTNFAVGGATTGTGNYDAIVRGISALSGTGMASQVAGFVANPPPFDPNRALFVIWGGPNDFFLSPSAATITPVLSNIQAEVLELAGIGARHILVPNMPNLGATPAAAAQGLQVQAQLQALTQAFDALLANTVGALDAALPADVMLFDTYGALQRILSDPLAFGLTNTTTPCILVPACVNDPQTQNTFLFWDSVHPTSSVHGIFASDLAVVLPEPGTGILLALAAAMASLLQALLRLHRLQPIASAGRRSNGLRT